MSERKVLRSILNKRKSFADLTTSARVSLYLILYNTRTLQSSRVLVLQGALCECCGDYDKAEEVYKKVLEENEAHQVGDERERERKVEGSIPVSYVFFRQQQHEPSAPVLTSSSFFFRCCCSSWSLRRARGNAFAAWPRVAGTKKRP